MRARWKRSGHFLCFGAVEPAEEEAAVKTRESSAGSSGRSEVLGMEACRHRRRLDRRVLAKIFRSVMFVSALVRRYLMNLHRFRFRFGFKIRFLTVSVWLDLVQNRSGEEGKHPNRSAARKASDDKRAAEWSGKSSSGDDRTTDAIFSSSSWTSSSTSSSSCLSSASSSWFREPELRQKRALPMADSRNHPPPAQAPARNYGSATGLFLLLLLSLLVMVFCGRLYAILWTSSCLCFVPRRNVPATGSPKLRLKGLEEIEKKRIIRLIRKKSKGLKKKKKNINNCGFL